jgi:hypothetical protein
MSFEIFVVCFKDKAPANYPRGLAEEIFKRDAQAPYGDLSEVRYADGYAIIHAKADDEIDGLVLERFNGRIALERLLEFADKTNAVIAWPGGETGFAVTRADVLEQVLDDFAEHGDTIAVLANVDEFIEVAEIIFL